jgi:hypothetical protein
MNLNAARRGMLYLAIKALISGALIALASEVAKANPGLGALITALPLVTILAMIWLWRDTGDALQIAAYARATFWLVLPTLPMLLLLPWMLTHGFGFWTALGLGAALTVLLYLATIYLLPHLGIDI